RRRSYRRGDRGRWRGGRGGGVGGRGGVLGERAARHGAAGQRGDERKSRQPLEVEEGHQNSPCPDAVRQSAAEPVSPVRMRTASSTFRTKILPSPILPVAAAALIASTALPTAESSTTASSCTLGRKFTWYSAPR